MTGISKRTRRRSAFAIGGTIALAAAATLVALRFGYRLQIVTILLPAITLGLVFVLIVRQHRLSNLAQARLMRSAEAYARIAALSDALERAYAASPQRPYDRPCVNALSDALSRDRGDGQTRH